MFVFRSKDYVKKCSSNLSFLRTCLEVIGADAINFFAESNSTNEDYRMSPIGLSDTNNVIFDNLAANLNNNYSITGVQRVYNPFLALHYELKKLQCIKEKEHFDEKLLFHGTKYFYLHSICSQNFDWRRFGKYNFLTNGIHITDLYSFDPSYTFMNG